MEIGVFKVSRILIFIIGSIFITILSRRTFKNTKSHGFYRFFAFESILLLILLNVPFWFRNPFSLLQLVSWPLLFFSIYLVIEGVRLLKELGSYKPRGEKSETYRFEETNHLVTDGIFKYIRHPLYSSLLFFAWGAYLKHISLFGSIGVLLATTSLLLTAKMEERENLLYFGSSYAEYMKSTKMFIPYVF